MNGRREEGVTTTNHYKSSFLPESCRKRGREWLTLTGRTRHSAAAGWSGWLLFLTWEREREREREREAWHGEGCAPSRSCSREELRVGSPRGLKTFVWRFGMAMIRGVVSRTFPPPPLLKETRNKLRRLGWLDEDVLTMNLFYDRMNWIRRGSCVESETRGGSWRWLVNNWIIHWWLKRNNWRSQSEEGEGGRRIFERWCHLLRLTRQNEDFRDEDAPSMIVGARRKEEMRSRWWWEEENDRRRRATRVDFLLLSPDCSSSDWRLCVALTSLPNALFSSTDQLIPTHTMQQGFSQHRHLIGS